MWYLVPGREIVSHRYRVTPPDESGIFEKNAVTRVTPTRTHVTKKAPLTTVTFLLPVTGGHSGRNGKRACFFPVIFRSFESLSVVTDGQTDGQTDTLKGYQLSSSSRWRG